MKYRTRINFTPAQKSLMWDRWQHGDSMREIAKLFDRYHSSVQKIIAREGGIRPRPRVRSPRSLSLAERATISRGLVAGWSIRSIASSLSRSPSTVSREVERNGGRRRYRAHSADKTAWERAKRPKPCKLFMHPALAQRVASRLEESWSPEQIAGWLKRTYPDDESLQVSQGADSAP